jgi:hypothetical protein
MNSMNTVNSHPYILKPYKGLSSRNTCPSCEHEHQFTRYIDRITKVVLNDKVGRCNRENSCGYHYTPKQFFADNPTLKPLPPKAKVIAMEKNLPSEPIALLPFDLMEASVLRHKRSNFYPFLETLFRDELASLICREYFIGANKNGNTAFWQVDINGKIRQAKIMQYNSATGRRNKKTGVTFAGKAILNNVDANLQQCFFGEYRLTLPENKDKPIAIVESEKTAVIASVYFGEFVWIATGGKHGCKWTTHDVCKVLRGRKVVLFPDLGAFEIWKTKGELMAAVAGCKVSVSDILERSATEQEKTEGLDLADFLLRKKDSSGLALTDGNYPVLMDCTDKKFTYRQYYIQKAEQDLIKYGN